MKSKDQVRAEKNLYLFTKELFESDREAEKAAILQRYCDWRGSHADEDTPCYCGHTSDCGCADPGVSEFKSGLETFGITGEDLLKSFCHRAGDK